MTDNPYPSRKKMRFTGFDYKTQGCYFITVVTFNRTCLFGHVENEEMILSDSGKMIDHIYHTIEERFLQVGCMDYVVMPNHFHCILYLDRKNDDSIPKVMDYFKSMTTDVQACLDFYVGILGMEHRESNGHHNLYFPGGKISIHTKKGEFQPAALNPTFGSQDFCLIVENDLETVEQDLMTKGIKLLTHIVERHGAHGTMRSIYVRDPDGNLVELSNYC